MKLAKGHFECTVYLFHFNNWSEKPEIEISKALAGIRLHYISTGRKPFMSWFISWLVEKIAIRIYPFTEKSLRVAAFAHSKRSWLLHKKLRAESEQYDWIIAHNLAALYPAFTFAKQNKTKFAFDVEDYHPGEVTGVDKDNEAKRRAYLLQEILPHTTYVSYASPGIGDSVKKLLKNKYQNAYFFIPNCFPQEEFILDVLQKDFNKLRLVWFSQYITSQRGLEELLEAAEPLKADIELYLIGELKPHFAKEIAGKADFLHIYPAMPQKDLHKFVGTFDVGLALEISKVDINKDIAVSNKIYAYAQAGLYVLATDTKGQSWFMKTYPWCGEIVSQNAEAIESSIKNLIANKEEIRKQKRERFEKGSSLSWENTSSKLLQIWK